MNELIRLIELQKSLTPFTKLSTSTQNFIASSTFDEIISILNSQEIKSTITFLNSHTYESIKKLQNNFDYFNSLCVDLSQFEVLHAPIDDLNFDSWDKLAVHLSGTLIPSISQSLKSNDAVYSTYQNLVDSLSRISIHDEQVNVPKEVTSALSSDFPSTDIDTESKSVSNTNMVSFSIRDFLVFLLIQILIPLIPILQTYYLHKIDTLESQQNQIKTEAFQQQLLDLTEQQNESLEAMTEQINLLMEQLQSLQSPQPMCQPVPESDSIDP